jgi:serine/tyrosine/threonine adenylyltransferase
MGKLTGLHFDNTYSRLPDPFYSRIDPTPLLKPYLVSFNRAAAELIDLDPAEAQRSEFVDYFSGRSLLPGSKPIAMRYSGHQFGQYVPQLGDGRAILLGEVRNQKGEKWDLHLKGAGKTLFARGFDGRAVLRSSIREYLCSEAMHGLSIPTTRALSVIGSEEPVFRETIERAAVLLRISPSHVRFGTFEIFYYTGQHERVKDLADYVIDNHFSHLSEADERYRRFFEEVVERTARLIAGWQAVGFAHGVMNTDNMSILGITIDYGPFRFMDDYDVGLICNHSDTHGRYAFAGQPGIGYWNLACLAQTLLPLITEEQAMEALDTYESAFSDHYGKLMRAKLGLEESLPEDVALVAELLRIMQANHVDYTNFFRLLGEFKFAPGEENSRLREMFIDWEAFDLWAEQYRMRLTKERSVDQERKLRMDRVNPKYVLRNYLAQTAIAGAEEDRDHSEIDRLLELLRDPFSEQPGMERYAALPPDWNRDLVISCSS